MRHTDDEARFEAASLTMEMVALVERFLDGRATREELCSWARNVHKTYGRSAFVHNGAADALHTCLWNLDETIPSSDEPVRDRPPSARTQDDERLRLLVREAHERSRRTYGSPRVHAELAANGERVSRKRIVRLMQHEELVARKRRRYKCSTMSEHDQPIAPNLLKREFDAEAPNQRWVGDTTELYVGPAKAKMYLATILDLFSRFVVGWAVSAVNDRHLTLKALEMALRRRCPDAGLLHHSDQGSTYASEDYRRKLEAHGITCSMSRCGNCLDNAAVESWFSTLKSELAERFESHQTARADLFDYIEVFYNQQRRHSALGYMSPAGYERSGGSSPP
jgi:putative transposase